jgi:ABC-type taurine transport system substrate-binding protein
VVTGVAARDFVPTIAGWAYPWPEPTGSQSLGGPTRHSVAQTGQALQDRELLSVTKDQDCHPHTLRQMR